jgi:hypothetical protein
MTIWVDLKWKTRAQKAEAALKHQIKRVEQEYRICQLVREDLKKAQAELGKAQANYLSLRQQMFKEVDFWQEEHKKLTELLERLYRKTPRTYYSWHPETEGELRPILEEVKVTLHLNTEIESEKFASRSEEKRIRTLRGDKNPLDPRL